MIDTAALKSQVDLLSLAGKHTSLRRVASSGGGEWAGACPFCGGQDRFRVQPEGKEGGRWLCRGCTEGKWHDAIEFGKRLWPGLSFVQVCELLSGGVVNTAYSRPVSSGTGPPRYTAPQPQWQAAALHAIQHAEHALWSREGQPALAYLQERGLGDETIRTFRLGWSSGMKIGLAGAESPPAPLSKGGGTLLPPLKKGGTEGGILPSGDPDEQSLWIPRGILIPCLAAGEVWYLKIALLPGDTVKCQGCGQRTPARQPCPKCGAANKYRGVRGNRTAAIFGADDLPGMDQALLVEGEFDAMIAWQELRDVIAVCTLGSAATRLDLAAWGPYLLPLERIYAAYDADPAGQKGSAALQDFSERVIPCSLPPGAKDINDFVLNGGELWPWLKGVLAGE